MHITGHPVLVPTIIRRFLAPSKRGAGVATMMTLTSVGSLCASVLIGWSVAAWSHWRPATVVLLVLSVVFALMWSLASTVRTPSAELTDAHDDTHAPHTPAPPRTALPRWVLYLTAYFTLQSAMVFAQIAWLVPTLRDWGISSAQTATLFSIMTGMQVIGGFGVPLMAQRSARPTGMIWAMAGLVSGGTVGLVLGGKADAPFGLLFVVTLVVATGHGGLFAIVNYVLSAHSTNAATTTRNTAFTMGLSQLLGAAGPLLFGVAIDAWGFDISWIVMAVAGLSLLVLAGLLVRSLHVNQTLAPSATQPRSSGTT